MLNPLGNVVGQRVHVNMTRFVTCFNGDIMYMVSSQPEDSVTFLQSLQFLSILSNSFQYFVKFFGVHVISN